MDTEDFVRDIVMQLHALNAIGSDIDDLASSDEGYRLRQELMGKAERVYDVKNAIKHALEQWMAG